MTEQILAAEAALADAAKWRALEMSAQHAARPRHRGIFIRRLLGRAGVAEAVEVFVATLHRRRHHCVVTTYNQSRDHGEERLGILSLLSQIRISTLDIARDADI